MPAPAPTFRLAPAVVDETNEALCFVTIEGTVGFTAKARATDESLNSVEDTLVIPANGLAVIALDVSTLLDGEDVTFDGAQEDGGDPGFTFDAVNTQVSPKDSSAVPAVPSSVTLEQDLVLDQVRLVITGGPVNGSFSGGIADFVDAAVGPAYTDEALDGSGDFTGPWEDTSGNSPGRATATVTVKASGGTRSSAESTATNGIRSVEMTVTQVQPPGDPAYDIYSAILDVSDLADGTLDVLVSQISATSGVESAQASTTVSKEQLPTEVTLTTMADGLGDYSETGIDVSILDNGPLVFEVCSYDEFLIKSCATQVVNKLGAEDANISGSLLGSITQASMRIGGKLLIIDIAGATFKPVLGPADFDALTAGLDSDKSGPLQWNTLFRDGAILDTDWTQDSDTSVCLRLPGVDEYRTDEIETITVTVPASTLTAGGPIIANQMFTISPNSKAPNGRSDAGGNVPTQTPGQVAASVGRRRGLADPTYSLYRTHSIAPDAAPIDTDLVYGDEDSRKREFTKKVRVRRTDVGSSGVIFEYGGNGDHGMAAWIDGSTLGFAAGANSGDGGVAGTADVLTAEDRIYEIVFAVRPGSGDIRVWVDGTLVIRETAVNGALDGPWAGAEDGAMAQVQTTVTDRVPAPQRIALTDAEIVGPASAYLGQRPRQFNGV